MRFYPGSSEQRSTRVCSTGLVAAMSFWSARQCDASVSRKKSRELRFFWRPTQRASSRGISWRWMADFWRVGSTSKELRPEGLPPVQFQSYSSPRQRCKSAAQLNFVILRGPSLAKKTGCPDDEGTTQYAGSSYDRNQHPQGSHARVRGRHRLGLRRRQEDNHAPQPKYESCADVRGSDRRVQ